MSKQIKRDSQPGRFVIGRSSAEKFSAVEGQFHTARTRELLPKAGEDGEAQRARIRAEFAKKK